MTTKLNRRAFVSVISKSSAIGFIAPAWIGAESQASHVFLTKPYLQNPMANAMTICWITAKPSHSWVEFQEVKGGEQRKAQAVVLGLVVANNTMHRITLRNLKPGVTYRYRVCSREIQMFKPYEKTFGETIFSDFYQFTTPDPSNREVSMLILNDIHDRPLSFGQLMKLNGTDPFDFVFLNGDMFDYQESEQQLIDHLIQPCTEIFASEKPFLFVRGNHETRGKFAYHLADYFENINNQPYFSFTRGPVHFISLDTGEDKVDEDVEYDGLAAFDAFRKEEARWLEAESQSKSAKEAAFRVVLMHIPPFHSGDWHGTMHCRKLFSPLFEKYGVDMVISGHTHRYGVHKPQEGHSYPIIIGGGPKEGNRTLIKLKANERELNLSMLADTGTEVGAYRLVARKRK